MKFAQYYSSQISRSQEDQEESDKFIKSNHTKEESQEEFQEINLKTIQPSNIIAIYRNVLFLALQATIVFGVTFLVYPGTILSTKFDMLDGNKSAESWFNIIMLTIFSLCDTIGRFLAGVWRPFNKNTIAIMTFGRFVFIFTSIAIQLGIPHNFDI